MSHFHLCIFQTSSPIKSKWYVMHLVIVTSAICEAFEGGGGEGGGERTFTLWPALDVCVRVHVSVLSCHVTVPAYVFVFRINKL